MPVQEQLSQRPELLALEKQVFSSPVFQVKKESQFSEDALQDLEADILALGENYRRDGKEQKIATLIRLARPFLHLISKVKAAKLVKSLMDMYLSFKADSASDDGILLCRETVDWARSEKRSYLRQALEERLVGLLYKVGRYDEAIAIAEPLTSELRRINDNQMLMKILLWQSRAFLGLQSLDKSRNSLSNARAIAHSIYLAPNRQADLDMQSGILNFFEGKDFKTAYSYFYEAFEQYDSINDKKAIDALKYMLLAQIIQNRHAEVMKIISGRFALKYVGPGIDAMKAISIARRNRSLSDFESALATYEGEFKTDHVFKKHVGLLYENLMEQNINRIVEPYSSVQVKYIAQKIDRTVKEVELSISRMILDKKISGILQHQAEDAFLVVFDDEQKKDTITKEALVVFSAMSLVVDMLYQKSLQLYV